MTIRVARGSESEAKTESGLLRLRVTAPGDPGAVRRGEPVTVGVPLPRGLVRDMHSVAVSGPQGRIDVQQEVLESWSDGSIRWLLLDFQADLPADYDLTVERAEPTQSSQAPRVTVATSPEAIRIGTSVIDFHMPRTGQLRVEARTQQSKMVVSSLWLEATGRDGQPLAVMTADCTVETDGPLRSTVCSLGTIGGRRGERLEFTARLHFFAGLPVIRCELALTNPSPAAHPGGFWQLGDGGSFLFDDISVRLSITENPEIACCIPEPGAEPVNALPELELVQVSSGGRHWDSPVHRNRQGIVPMGSRGYQLRSGSREITGLRAVPVAWIDAGGSRIALAMEHFWQNFPKTLECRGRDLILRLFPHQSVDLHELQGGERKTHVFHAAFAAESVGSSPLDWTRHPALATPGPDWFVTAEAVPYLTAAVEPSSLEYDAMVTAAIEGPDCFAEKRETIDEYGWRHFGDIYADHEAVHAKDPSPVVSHYNNQYDALAGFAYQFMRSGDVRWWHGMQELASHVADIDIYHTLGDKAAYNGGLFWHTYHYRDAGLSTHRSYPRAQGIWGGGPSNEHAYSTGLMLHYFMTGRRESRAAAIGLADWVLRMDDGRLTVFRWLSRQRTGYASATGSASYHGPGRGAGNAIAVLLNGHRLTGDSTYLMKAEELLRRTIHPADDIEARSLLETELRWSYTVFLQAIGRYLDDKLERQEQDASYEYARSSLLQYARWMTEHEYPYLNKPEILEYPTETWAAQDMRKSEVFFFAARHAPDDERQRFIERAEHFYFESLRQLRERPTRTLARPLVILMTCGFRREGFHRSSPPAAVGDSVAESFGVPQVFIPQKEIARRRAITLAVGGIPLGLAFLVLLSLLL